MKSVRTIAAAITGTALLATSLTATIILNEGFDYPDGPLQGQGTWVRGVMSPSADNPSDYIVVDNGAVRFDWTTTDPVNNGVRTFFDPDQTLTTGMLYGIFDFRATQAPQAETEVRPGFISFASSDGSQQRGFVGLQAGSEAGTFQLGVSPRSQVGTAFSFSQDLQLNVTYSVMVGFNIETEATSLWINSTNPASVADVIVGTTDLTNNGMRRVNLRMYNTDGDTGTTNLGIFEIDNLVVTTVPEPATYAALLGLLALAMIVRRRRRG
jgi:hypothetical protein